MQRAAHDTGTGAAPAEPNVIDLRQPRVGVDDVAAVLDTVAADLRDLWSEALRRADFSEVTRLVEASHAVHRAIVALRAEQVISDSRIVTRPR